MRQSMHEQNLGLGDAIDLKDDAMDASKHLDP